jgi:hypothetical protein
MKGMALIGSVVAALLFASTSARAQSGPATRAFTLDRGSFSGGPEYGSNDLNLGLGVRGGYTLTQGIYLGIAADYYFGTSEEATLPGAGSIKSSAHGWDLLGDVGYDFGVTPNVVIRPFGGFGIFGASGEVCSATPGAPTTTCVSSSASKGVGSFGGLALVELGSLNLGGELRLLFYNSDTAALIGGRIGMTF